MKKIAMIITACFVLFAGCKDDDPTIFEGKVVYADDETPFSGGWIHISMKGRFPTTDIDRKRLELDDTGTFSAKFEYNGEANLFDIVVISKDLKSYFEASGLDCSPNRCNNFTPGKSYKNLVLKVSKK